jgi:hypothetical protein
MIVTKFPGVPYFGGDPVFSEPERERLHRQAGQLGLTRDTVHLAHHLSILHI